MHMRPRPLLGLPIAREGSVVIQTKCRTCHADIVWCLTPVGRKMPINTWTSPGGGIMLEDPESDEPVIRFVRKGEEVPEGTKRYVSHFSTCKDAKTHRKPK